MGMIKWLEGTGPEEDVVISSRIRLARNLNNYQFPQHMNLEDAKSVTDEILNAAKDSIDSGNYNFVKIKDLDYLDKGFYVEKHLISPERSEEHTSELQSRFDLVCRLLLEKKKK